MTVWALIGCTKTKADHPCTAREMYWPSALFRGAWETAEAAGQKPFILSAKYGLLTPETVIEPYDVTLAGARRLQKHEWAMKLFYGVNPITAVIKPGDHAVSYLGDDYSLFLVGWLRGLHGVTVEEPLKGMSQGKRLQWFKERRQIHA